jgi:hypothetical protein
MTSTKALKSIGFCMNAVALTAGASGSPDMKTKVRLGIAGRAALIELLNAQAKSSMNRIRELAKGSEVCRRADDDTAKQSTRRVDQSRRNEVKRQLRLLAQAHFLVTSRCRASTPGHNQVAGEPTSASVGEYRGRPHVGLRPRMDRERGFHIVHR